MADLNTAANLEGAFAAGAGIAAHDLANIGEFSIWDIPAPGGALDVVAVFIGAANETGHLRRGVIHHDSDGGTHWAQRAKPGAQTGFYFVGFRHHQWRRHARQFGGLDGIESMVTANHQRHQFALLIFGEQCFDRLLSRDI